MQLRTVAGVIELAVLHGQDPSDGHWGCPIRERWGLACHQQLSLALADKLAFTVTATGSYAEAAAVAGKWGVPVADATLHALTQRLGAKAEARTQAALQSAPAERQPERAPTALAVLMVDGWQVRQRGPGWGKKQTRQPRVEWHEWKTGVFYRHEQSGRTAGGRGVLSEKIVIGWQGEPAEFGRRLHWEALRGGLSRAQHRLVAGDGAAWIWNLAQDRWAGATQVLDFYHASQHLWELGRAVQGEEEGALARWVEPRRHRLRHGQEKRVLQEIAALPVPAGPAGGKLPPRKKLFGEPSRADELPGLGAARLADRLRTRRIGLSPEAMPVQTTGPVLDGSRHASSGRAHRSSSQSSLGRTVALLLIGGSVRMYPWSAVERNFTPATLHLTCSCRSGTGVEPMNNIDWSYHRPG